MIETLLVYLKIFIKTWLTRKAQICVEAFSGTVQCKFKFVQIMVPWGWVGLQWGINFYIYKYKLRLFANKL